MTMVGKSLGDNSSPAMAELTREEFPFRKKENNFSFNHKDCIGLFLNLVLWLFLVCLCRRDFLLALLWLIVLVVCIWWKPSRVLSMASLFFALFLRTPEFLDLKTQFPQHALFEDPATFAMLQKEVRAYLARTNGGKDVAATKDSYGRENEYIGSGGCGENQWRILSIKVTRVHMKGASEEFPTLCALLEKCPDVIACVLSILEPKCKIPMHVGYYKGLMRFMVPVIVPKDRNNLWLAVNGIKYHWEEGKTVLWDDTFPHAVYNTTDEVRVLFYCDVLRTHNMPWCARKLNQFMVYLFEMSGVAEAEIKKNEVKKRI